MLRRDTVCKETGGADGKKKFDWDDIDGVLLYELGYKPWEVYRLLMKDIYRIFHGRGNKYESDRMLLGNAVVVLSDVFNQTMGGNGARDTVMRMWGGFPENNGGREMTREERRELIRRHNQMLADIERRKRGE